MVARSEKFLIEIGEKLPIKGDKKRRVFEDEGQVREVLPFENESAWVPGRRNQKRLHKSYTAEPKWLLAWYCGAGFTDRVERIIE